MMAGLEVVVVGLLMHGYIAYALSSHPAIIFITLAMILVKSF